MSKLKTRPVKLKTYLERRYKDPIEQNYDMIFFNEKYLKELKEYDIFDDSFGKTLETVAYYKQRLAEISKLPEEEAIKKYVQYCEKKMNMIKRIVELNKIWYERERVGISLINNLEEFGQHKRELETLRHDLGAWIVLLKGF